MDTKITITLEADPDLGLIGQQAMKEALGELFKLGDVPVLKIRISVRNFYANREMLHQIQDRIDRALADVPRVVEVDVETKTKKGVERRKRDERPMDKLWTPEAPGIVNFPPELGEQLERLAEDMRQAEPAPAPEPTPEPERDHETDLLDKFRQAAEGGAEDNKDDDDE
jgi:hypothetical protein